VPGKRNFSEFPGRALHLQTVDGSQRGPVPHGHNWSMCGGVLLDTWRNGNAVSRNAMDPCEAHTGIWVRRRGCKWKGPVPPCSSLFVLNGSEADPDSRFEVEPGNMNESRNEATPRQLCTKLGAVGSACMRRRNMQLQQCTACAAPGQVLADRLAM